jgi:hypothetical protein
MLLMLWERKGVSRRLPLLLVVLGLLLLMNVLPMGSRSRSRHVARRHPGRGHGWSMYSRMLPLNLRTEISMEISALEEDTPSAY